MDDFYPLKKSKRQTPYTTLWLPSWERASRSVALYPDAEITCLVCLRDNTTLTSDVTNPNDLNFRHSIDQRRTQVAYHNRSEVSILSQKHIVSKLPSQLTVICSKVTCYYEVITNVTVTMSWSSCFVYDAANRR